MKNQDNIQKWLILDTLVLGTILAIISCIFIFFGKWFVPVSVIIGLVITIVNHLLLIAQSNMLTKKDPSASAAPFMMLSFVLRLVLYAGGMVAGWYIAGGKLYDGLYGIFGAFIPYMIIRILILTKYSKYNKPMKSYTNGEKK